MFPDSPEVQKSFNYDLFKKIDWNRSICKMNFTKLLKENREKFQLHRFPILVTKDFKIVDGQHRYEVAKEIGSPVYYIRDGIDDSFKSVHSVNKAGKKHSLKDKLEMLYRSGDSGAEMVYKIFNLYQGAFDTGTIATILISGYTGGGNVNDHIDKSGTLPINYYDLSIEVLDALYYSGIPKKGSKRVVFALMGTSRKSGVHPKAIVKRVMTNLIKWVDPKSTEEAVRVILGCYNYGLMPKNKISLEKKA